jgi:ribosome maturation protein Sdo1
MTKTEKEDIKTFKSVKTQVKEAIKEIKDFDL